MFADYAPFQAWVTQIAINNPYRKASGITEYDPVHAGNIMPGEIPISDPGQLGRANLPSLHGITTQQDAHLNPSLPPTDTLPTVIPRVARWALRGGQYNPFSFRPTPEEHERYQELPTASQPMGPTGAGQFDTVISKHGPATIDELESDAGVRQPRYLRQKLFLRKLFMLPHAGYTLDATGAHDERTIPQTGQEDKDKDYLTDAAVGVANSFVVPDVRRTFDQPKDAPIGSPRDASGLPIYNKAGYRLTPNALVSSAERIDTSHSYPNFNVMTESAVGSSAQRVRAGVQYDIASTRPSVMPHWFYYRPFDKLVADHDYAIKGIVSAPSVSRPVMVTSEPAANVPWSAGRRYTMPPAGMTAIAVQPNIDRNAPQSWDTNMYLEPANGLDMRQARWRMS